MPIGPLAALAYDRACPADCERRFGFGWPGAEPEFGVVAAACGLMYPVHGLSVSVAVGVDVSGFFHGVEAAVACFHELFAFLVGLDGFRVGAGEGFHGVAGW